MDPVTNPFAPGAGIQPPVLAGRDDLLKAARIAAARVRAGRSTHGLLLVGLRGVGKTVLLERMRADLVRGGLRALLIDASDGRSLPALLASEMRKALIALSNVDAARARSRHALRALAGFAQALKAKYADIEIGVDFAPQPGLADAGDLSEDLTALLEAAGQSAKKAGTALVIFIDEMQYIATDQLTALVMALHRTTQRNQPVMLFGAGLPQLWGRLGEAKSYAEPMFVFKEIGALKSPADAQAITRPLANHSVTIKSDALERLLVVTRGYPYFLQEWGKQVWLAAPRTPIRLADVARASRAALAGLDQDFFMVRFERLRPSERHYLRAMAELGHGPHRSGGIAAVLGERVQSVAPVRNQLIEKGLVWSPDHGETAFTAPLFDEFLKRIMPNKHGLHKQ